MDQASFLGAAWCCNGTIRPSYIEIVRSRIRHFKQHTPDSTPAASHTHEVTSFEFVRALNELLRGDRRAVCLMQGFLGSDNVVWTSGHQPTTNQFASQGRKNLLVSLACLFALGTSRRSSFSRRSCSFGWADGVL